MRFRLVNFVRWRFHLFGDLSRLVRNPRLSWFVFLNFNPRLAYIILYILKKRLQRFSCFSADETQRGFCVTVSEELLAAWSASFGRSRNDARAQCADEPQVLLNQDDDDDDDARNLSERILDEWKGRGGMRLRVNRVTLPIGAGAGRKGRQYRGGSTV